MTLTLADRWLCRVLVSHGYATVYCAISAVSVKGSPLEPLSLAARRIKVEQLARDAVQRLQPPAKAGEDLKYSYGDEALRRVR